MLSYLLILSKSPYQVVLIPRYFRSILRLTLFFYLVRLLLK